MTRPLVAVVLAGGTGTRLYPATRRDRPKQFLSFGGGRSLFARTVDRVDFADRLVVSTRAAFAADVSDRAPDATVVVEPTPRDTGPALVYVAHRVRDLVGDCVLLCVPSDHWIDGDFESVGRSAAQVAVETGGLVTVGIEPTRPATEYGYVVPDSRDGDAFSVGRFVEKPSVDAAAALIEDGCYWNAGIFAWTPNALLREARASPLAPLVDALDAGDPERGFESVDPVSVDRAVMEGADRASVVPGGFAWDDLGSWDAVERVTDEPLCESLELDAAGNVLAGDKHVTVIGLDELVVAAYDDRVLVAPKAEAQRVREAVAVLRDRGDF